MQVYLKILDSLMFSFIKLTAHMNSISGCKRVQSIGKFIKRKLLITANNMYLEYLITLKRSLMSTYIKKQEIKNRSLWGTTNDFEKQLKNVQNF